MSNCCASSASVFSPLTAARATFALNAGVWFRRGRLVIASPVRHAYWPLSGRNSTYPDVQISRASSFQINNAPHQGCITATPSNRSAEIQQLTVLVKTPSNTRRAALHLIKQRLSLPQIGGGEALGEPAIDRR